MCTFCQTSELPSHEKGSTNKRKSFISMFLKPNKENERYIFRLLFYRQSKKNDRKDAYILQKVHDHWGTSSKGNKIVDDLVVCPGTEYVHYDDSKFVLNEKTGKKQLNCPICKKAQEQMAAWMNSGKTDKMSMQKFNQLKAKERLCVPVYVIHDPNTVDDEGKFTNDGKLKVLILTNKDDIKNFMRVVDEEKTKAYLASKEGHGYEVFNGGNAVNLQIRVDSVPEVRNQGKPNEYTTTVRKIVQIAFGKNTQPISAINKEAIDQFEFDDQFYFSNTKMELEDFYAKYYGQSEVCIDDEDAFSNETSTTVTETIPEPQTKASTENPFVTPTQVTDSEIDDILETKTEEEHPQDTSPEDVKAMQTQEGDIDSILNSIDL